MEERKVAIQVSGVKKQYQLGAIGGKTLQEDLQSWWAKKRGKEDPNAVIGTDQRLLGKTFMALNGIDLTIYEGERVGIIGINGAGKSTLLKILARITAPTEGTIDIWGRLSTMLEIGTGFHGEMTGRENVYLNGAILGMKKEEIDQKMDAIIAFSEVGEFIDTPVKRYSSGMFVKLAFAVAAHLNAEIMVMDEVLAVGDMAFQRKCLDRMRLAAEEEGRTVLYVSHNMNTIRRLCERVVVMDQGKIIFDGDVEEGIAVYMDHCLDENQVDMNLDEMTHTGNGIDKGIRMKHLVLVDKVTPSFEHGECLRLRMKVEITKPLENVRFRLTLRTDGDVGLGTAWSELLYFRETGEREIEIDIPLDQIA
ncbi:MAG: polysaccharide ABC transporter ATP-binding protein, partial [Lachnospiraceae bacterium]|nr:polysaccharide ABC transporter ATP-binding protein [Lachnospiraceae bacterium]